MRKIISIILCAVIFVSAFSFSAFAATPSDAQKKCEDDIINAIWDMKASIDVSKYKFKYSFSGDYVVCDEIDDIMRKIYYNYPEINYYLDTNQYYYNYGSGIIKKITFNYTMSKSEMLTKRKYLSDMATYVYNKINPAWSDMQKTLYIHDFIASNYCYDTRLYTVGGENHGMLEMFESGTGVCQAYAYAMIYFLRQVDIKSYMAISLEDNHGWNVVKIDGRWYHVDATHDDPLYNKYSKYDSFGRVQHDKFLLSDTEIDDGYHDNWYIPFKIEENNIYCSKYYGPDLYKEALSSMVPMDDGYWYYMDYDRYNGGLKKTKDFYSSQLVYKFDDIWDIRGDNYGYSNLYTGLFEYNGNLFFTDETMLYTYDPEDNKTVAVFGLTAEAQQNYGRFFGFQMIDEKCYLVVTKNANFENVQVLVLDVCEKGHAIEKWMTYEEATIFKTGRKVLYCDICLDILDEQEIPKIPLPQGAGDVNGDGMVTTADLATQKLFLADVSGVIVKSGADFNKDGKVNTTDLALLKLYLASF